MKYVEESIHGMPMVELTRRNLEALLKKLDDPHSVRTLIDPDNKIAVKAVENEEHYGDRPPGPMIDEVYPGLRWILMDRGLDA